MRRTSLTTLSAVALTGLLMFSCAGGKPTADQYSGFLQDYSQVQKTKSPKGDPVLRFISPRLRGGNYSKIIIEPVQYYPEPKPSENVSAEILDQIQRYFDQAIRREAAERMSVVESPGPGVTRLRVALTGVGSKAEGLKPYQFIPVAMVLTGARAATTGHPEQAVLYMEAELSDSVSGERLGIAIKGGTGERIKKIRGSGRQVTLESLQPLLDRWAEAAVESLQEIFQAK